MKRDEWMASSDPFAMLGGKLITGKYCFGSNYVLSDRKLRLFTAAWYRLCPPHTDQDDRHVKQMLAGKLPPDSLLHNLNPSNWPTSSPRRRKVLDFQPTGASLLGEIIGDPFGPAVGGARNGLAVGDVLRGGMLEHGGEELRQWLAWNDFCVMKVAQEIWDLEAFDRMPILADALEEAGCDRSNIIMHCRAKCPFCFDDTSSISHDGGEADLIWLNPDRRKGPSKLCLCRGTGWMPHVRGCWVLDLCLGQD